MAMNFNSIGIGFILTNLMLSYIIGIIVMGGFIQILISMISINTGVTIAKIIEIPVYGILLISKMPVRASLILQQDYALTIRSFG